MPLIFVEKDVSVVKHLQRLQMKESTDATETTDEVSIKPEMPLLLGFLGGVFILVPCAALLQLATPWIHWRQSGFHVGYLDLLPDSLWYSVGLPLSLVTLTMGLGTGFGWRWVRAGIPLLFLGLSILSFRYDGPWGGYVGIAYALVFALYLFLKSSVTTYFDSKRR